MRITQDEYGSTSHKGSLARDDGGESTANDSPVLAPFDGYFARVRTDSSHETYFVSDGPVECANGYVGVITFLFMHDNVNRFSTGAYVKRGEIIGYEGGFGGGRKDRFAHHTHREWSKGKNTTQSRNTSGTYVIANQMHEYDVCFLRPDSWSRKLKAEMARFAQAHPGIPELTAHELRHTYGTYLRRHGADIYSLSELRKAVRWCNRRDPIKEDIQ